MPSLKLVSVLALACGLTALTGCAADATSDEGSEDPAASEDALKANIQPGTFKLYAQAGATPSQYCDVHTQIDLKNVNGARAVLAERLGAGSTCKLMVFPNAREFSLKKAGTSCGSTTYKGSRQKDGKKYAITVTDHRFRLCDDAVPARIVVEETAPGEPPTTRYSYDGLPRITGQFAAGDVNSLSGKLFAAMKAYALANPSDTAHFVQAVGGSTVTFESNGNLAQCTGAVLMGGVKYTCRLDVKPGGFEWTSSSDSVQAELYDAIREATNGGRTVELKEGKTSLKCEAGTLGLAAVMSYRCEAKF